MLSYHLIEFKRLLDLSFNYSEIEVLCFDLGISSEKLDKYNLTLSLLKYCERHSHLEDLLMYCKKQRPNLNWSVIKQYETSKVKLSSYINNFPNRSSLFVNRIKEKQRLIEGIQQGRNFISVEGYSGI